MLTAAISAAAAILFYALITLCFSGKAAELEKVKNRLSEMTREVSRAYMTGDDEMNRPFAERIIKPLLKKLTNVFASFIPAKRRNRPNAEKLKKLLQQAGWTVSAEEFAVIRLVLTAVGALAGLGAALLMKTDTERTVLYTLGGAFAAYALLRYFVSSCATRRKAAMEKQLPDMLDLLSVSVAAGLGFERAMLHIIETMDGPLIDEFAVSYREMSMGRSRKDALTLLGERCGVEDLSSVTGALVQAGQLGIPMKNVLQSQAAAIRSSRRSKVQEKAAKVSTKILLPMIGLIFPVLIIVLMGPSLITILEQFG